MMPLFEGDRTPQQEIQSVNTLSPTDRSNGYKRSQKDFNPIFQQKK